MQTILVTGAEGYAGGYVLAHLREHGYQIVAGVRNRARKLAYERQDIKALVCDVADAINVARVVASVRPQGIIHLAGISRPAEATAEPLLAYQSIVTGWANLLDAARRAVPRAKLVLASACEVYGDAGSHLQPLAETATPLPVNTFGSLKYAAEAIANTYYRDYQMDVTIARPFHYAGPGQPPRFFFGAVARRLATWDTASNGDELWLPDLSCRRELMHVEDVAAGYVRLLEQGRPNEVYNLSSGQAHTCRELVTNLADEFGLRLDLRELPVEEDDAQIMALCGDNTKMRLETDWQPTRGPDVVLREMVRAYRSSAAAVGN